MYQHGILSFATLKNERGDITDGKLFLLDEEQKDFITAVVNDQRKKDFILTGKCTYYLFLTKNFVYYVQSSSVVSWSRGLGRKEFSF